MQTEKLGFGPNIPNFEFAESRAERACKKKEDEDKKKTRKCKACRKKMLISHKSRRHGRRDDRGIELWFKKSSLGSHHISFAFASLISIICFTYFGKQT